MYVNVLSIQLPETCSSSRIFVQSCKVLSCSYLTRLCRFVKHCKTFSCTFSGTFVSRISACDTHPQFQASSAFVNYLKVSFKFFKCFAWGKALSWILGPALGWTLKCRDGLEPLQQYSVCNPAKIFFTSKLSYLLHCFPTPPIKLKLGQEIC